MLQKTRFAASLAALVAVPLTGCNLATNGLDYSHQAIIAQPAPAPAPMPMPMPEPPPPPPPPKCELNALGSCRTGDKVVLTGVNFDFNKSTLTLNAKTILNTVADSIKTAKVRVEIGGYTDSKGSDAYNDKLSSARANSVKAYLHAHGVDSRLLSANGYGKADPIADNSTDEGREENRRVELKLLEGGA